MFTTTTLRRIAAPALALTMVGAACSDSDDTTLDAAARDAYTAVGASFFGDPSGIPALLDDLESAMPADLQDDAAEYAAGLTAELEVR